MRARSPNREKAEKIYLEAKGDIKLIDIANRLDVPEGTIRGWKNKDKWDDKLLNELNGTLQNGTERSNILKLPPRQERKELKEMDLDETELTEKQRLFCLYYIKSFNATMAAKKAGYSPDSAHVTGHDLLRNPKVKSEIKKLKGAMVEELFIDAMDVLGRYIKIAFADISDYVTFGQREQMVMGIYGPVEVKDPATGKKKPLMQKINYVDLKDSYNIDASIISEVAQGKEGIKIKLADKMKALDKLADYFDLFPDKFKRRIEEEKLNLLKRKSEEEDPEEMGDDGFIEALNAEAGKVWEDADED